MNGGVQVFRSLEQAAAAGVLRGGAVAIGNFDGVHLGHQKLAEVARAWAASRGRSAGVLTFEPHPVRVLRPQLAPRVITPLPRKLELLAGLGLDAAVVQPFDLGYAGTPAAEFAARDLAGRLEVADVVVGWDFTAGRDRARVDALRPLLERHGISLHVVDPVTVDGLVVSSTKVREFLREGNVEAAAQLLTRPYDLDGEVARGAGRGRGFGFPTANVATTGLLPANGVYVVRAELGGAHRETGLSGAAVHGGVCNVGVKPTVESGAAAVAEAHLFGFDGRDLYGTPIRLAFLARLRDEQRFPSVEALRAQIARDVEAAHRVLAG
ncbi:riboflavin biosynthesis protein RibF [Anaeromyxobacter sp. K]|uniref:riboflavin biosynthesis protein RibF n=1 Tax=Anaeromyxobacter sp. (strain K) TaxID=447217 RepID=UPI00015F9E8C|nr:riboflavin biosynthesis protein RibF [Anaeromyxobacter sp. K]ACG71894.1 riboflavin biosynthesis protein RibF [Anaeromyxobacter sp. K]